MIMKKSLSHLGSGLLFASIALAWSVDQDPQDPKRKQDSTEIAAMMADASKFTQPGEAHDLLKRFLGTWDSVTRIMGASSGGEAGTVEVSWLMEGRWLKSKSEGTMMGMPIETFMILGYDNFKQSYVWTTVSNMDTALRSAEGDLDPGGKALITYGTLDEYLTGEHDKMVRYVWRFLDEDKIVMEVHDLAIGENNTKVVEVEMTRRL